MRLFALIFTVVLTSALAGCDTGSITAPTSPTPLTITFGEVPSNGTTVRTYTEAGILITASSITSSWTAIRTFGNPAPFIQFLAAAGTAVVGEVRVDGLSTPFTFRSVDLYSSTTPIPYTIVGLRNRVPVFTLEGTVPNTFGNFRTVTNSRPDAVVDGLLIRLTNAAAACCRNPMGLDNIVLAR